MFGTSWKAFIIVAVIVILSGCQKEEPAGGLARIGDDVITTEDLEARMEGMPPFMRQQMTTPEGKRKLLDGMIEEEVLYRAALAEGLDKDEKYTTEMERRKRDILIRLYYDRMIESKSVPSDEEIRDYYESNPDEFKVAESVTARHILVKTKGEAVNLRKRIEQGNKFAELASEFSLDQYTKGAGGLISDPIHPGKGVKGMGAVPELVEACFATEVGKVSQPVKTAKGYHLILVESRSPEGIRPLDEARDDVISRLSYNKRKEITETTLDELKSKYRVSYLSEAERDTKTPEELFKTASESSTPRDKIKYYRQFIERFPDNERVYEAEFMIGFTLAEDLKDYDEAERIFSEFLKRYPDGDLSDDAEWMLENMRTGKEPDFGGE